MKAILHIGTEKTGTKSMQKFLWVNREWFNDRGVLIPTSVGIGNNRDVAFAAYNLNRRDDFTIQLGLTNDLQVRKTQKAIFNKLNKEVSKSQCGIVILSSEHFQSRLTEQSEIMRLKHLLINIGIEEFEVLLYLRNPVDLAASLYSTAIKAGATFSEAPPPSHPYWRNICDHRSTITNWGSVFSIKSIRPRIFLNKTLVPESLFIDFMEAINMEPDSGLKYPSVQNQGISSIGLEVLRRINMRIPRFIDGKPNIARRDLGAYFESFFPGHKYFLSDSLAQAYEDFYKESNDWVLTRFFPERSHLFNSVKRTSRESIQASSEELDSFAEFVLTIWERNKD